MLTSQQSFLVMDGVLATELGRSGALTQCWEGVGHNGWELHVGESWGGFMGE